MYKNPEDIVKYQKKYYKTNQKYLYQVKKQREELVLQWFKNYKKTLFCSKCGISFKDHPEWCDFHHVGDKDNEVSRIKTMGALIKELEKCIPVCANCHRTIHFGG